MKLLIPRPRGISVWAYTSSFGGGLVAGDQTKLELELRANTRTFLGTQASTKIYRNPERQLCRHRTQATMDEQSLLIFAPDPVQTFSHSSYSQEQEFNLAADANLLVVDSLSAGRLARGESWQFDHYSSTTRIKVEGRPVFLDAVRLDPADGWLQMPHRGGRFHTLSTIVLIGPALEKISRDILHHIEGKAIERRPAFLCSASPLPRGVVLRLAGENGEAVINAVRSCVSQCRSLLGDDPWSRKW